MTSPDDAVDLEVPEGDGPQEPDHDLMRNVLGTFAAPWRWMTSPVFYGMENIPEDRGALFVGNHTLFGALDVPLLLYELLDKRDLLLRSLGDRIHFDVLPAWRDLVTAFGVIEASPESCAELMRAGCSILVFPGGAREVCKRKGEKYELLWGERAGFARLALESRYPIIPVAAVGAEDCYDILFDANDIMKSPLKGAVEALGMREDLIPPLVRGVGPSLLPRPQRFYFRFGELIETQGHEGSTDDPDVVMSVRDQTKRALEEGIEWLLAEREEDPDRDFGSRFRSTFWPFS